MSTTDTRAAFEAWAIKENYAFYSESERSVLFYGVSGTRNAIQKAWEAGMAQAATEAAKAPEPCPDPEGCNAQGCCNPRGRCEEAKATGTAGEVQIDLPAIVKRLEDAVRHMDSYGYVGIGRPSVQSVINDISGALKRAARQPAPVVAVKTWESRLAGNPDRIFSEVVRRAMEAEISDLRVAVAASQQSKNLMAICEALRPFAEAYKPEHHTQTDDPKFQEFLDRNQITPNVTMGDFRRAHEAYLAATNRSQPAPAVMPPAVAVSRDADSPGMTGVLVTFARPLSDGQLRELHEYLNRSQP